MVAGAALIIAAGLVVLVRASRLPAMSGRYERPAGPVAATAGPAAGLRAGPGACAARHHAAQVRDGSSAPLITLASRRARTGAGRARPAPASMWESLSAGRRSDGVAGMSLAARWFSHGRHRDAKARSAAR